MLLLPKYIFVLFIANFLQPYFLIDKPLVILTENAPPNSYYDNGQLTGRAVEIVRAVLAEIDMEKQEILLYPWPRGYRMLQTKENIALFATSRTQLRESQFKWAGPIADNEVNLYRLKSRTDIVVNSIDDLQNYIVGSSRDDQKTEYLQAHGVKVDISKQDKTNIRKLFMGRVDIIPYAASRFEYDINQQALDPNEVVKVFNIESISTQIYIAFSLSTDDEVVKKFQHGFDEIKRKGIYREIMEKWDRQFKY